MGRGGWNLYPDQKEAISRFMKGLVKAPPSFTLESLDRKVRKAAESAKNTWANMTPEEREARCAKMRHKHNVSDEGRKMSAEFKSMQSKLKKGKPLSEHNKVAKAEAQRLIGIKYREYKSNGGEMDYNAFRKSIAKSRR